MVPEKSKVVLVTGGSGFLGSHCIIQLLQAGYVVRTTVRSIQKEAEVRTMISAGGVESADQLSFVEADLSHDTGWAEAVKGCRYVLHVASPFVANEPADENELIIPARDGALRVLKVAREASVERVVLTSSFAAIGYTINPVGHVFTEKDWTNPSSKTIGAYIKSKTVAELAAWDFIEKQGGDLELTVINPVGIFGPVLGKDYSVSIGLINSILTGELKESSPFSFGVVDVRDVAAIHLSAMTCPLAKGERFLTTSDGAMTFYDIAQLLKSQKKEIAHMISDLAKPDITYIKMSNQKARTLLNWHPRTKEEAILASADSILQLKSGG